MPPLRSADSIARDRPRCAIDVLVPALSAQRNRLGRITLAGVMNLVNLTNLVNLSNLVNLANLMHP